MSSDYYYAPSKNGIQKTLSAQLLSTASTGDAISLSDVDGIQNKPGVLVINRVDSNGTATPAAREYISFTGTSGSTVLIETRNVDNSASAKTHAVGSVVEFIPDVVWAQRIIDQQLVEHNVDGTHDSATVITLKATQAEVATGTEDAKIVTPLAAAPYANSSMSRQALINGNFDVWQRGTSVAVAQDATTWAADRWQEFAADDGGTAPTLTRSRQILTSGDIPNAFYYTRLTTNGAGTSFGANSRHLYQQTIENGNRFLCGLNKTVTLSFWARSSIANKKIGVYAAQNYGTTGSPSTAEPISGTNWTLTSSWVKYTHTFTTNTLVGKTFGTDNNDYLSIIFQLQWGTARAANVNDGTTAESYVGSGTIDIAQVQLCAGDVALPFQPKSFEEELNACKRYWRQSYSDGVAAGTVTNTGKYDSNSSTSVYHTVFSIELSPQMRVAPVITIYSPSTGASGKIRNESISADIDAVQGFISQKHLAVQVNNVASTAGQILSCHWTANAEL